MSEFRKLYAAREIENAWNKMQVGPLLERDKRPRRRVCTAAKGVFYIPISTPTDQVGQGVSSNLRPATGSSRTTPTSEIGFGVSSGCELWLPPNDRLQRVKSSAEHMAGAKSSPLYFGALEYVVERDQSSTTYWKRSGPEGEWVACDL